MIITLVWPRLEIWQIEAVRAVDFQVTVRNAAGDAVLWQRLKTQGDRWKYGYVQLPAVTDTSPNSDTVFGSYAVVFKATRGDGYRGDIALDDITARPGTCIPQGMADVWTACITQVLRGDGDGSARSLCCCQCLHWQYHLHWRPTVAMYLTDSYVSGRLSTAMRKRHLKSV